MSNALKYTELAPGLKISRVMAGLWQVADMERHSPRELDTMARAMTDYTLAGFTTFDMADHYGSAEDVAGIYHEKYRAGHDVQFLTKWVPKPGPVTKKEVLDAVHRSLNRMKVERIDLLQFHAWRYPDLRWLDCLFWLQEIQKEGLIAHLGLTNFDTAHLRIVIHSGIRVVSNQICYSLLDRRASGAMSELCREAGVQILAFGTLAGGFLSERWLEKPEPKELPTWSLMKYKRFIDAAGGWSKFQELLSALKTVAAENGVTIATMASRWILDQPAVAGVIIGARLSESQHIADHEKVFGFSLSEAHRERIAGVLSTLQSIPGDCGDEYRRPPYLTATGDLSHHVDEFPAPFETRTVSERTQALSGTVWESVGGFSRAVRKGDRIFVSGTTATHGARAIGGSDPRAQTHFIVDKIEAALISLGGRLQDVVRTRIFVKNIADWEAVARVHGDRFRDIQPANTLVSANLVGDEYLVEMEADAIVS